MIEQSILCTGQAKEVTSLSQTRKNMYKSIMCDTVLHKGDSDVKSHLLSPCYSFK